MSGTRAKPRTRVELADFEAIRGALVRDGDKAARPAWARIDLACHLLGVELEPAGLLFCLALAGVYRTRGVLSVLDVELEGGHDRTDDTDRAAAIRPRPRARPRP